MSEQTKAQDEGSGADQPAGQQFSIQKIYLKDTSFETPSSPSIFTEKWEPAVNVELQTSGSRLADNVHEVVLTVTLTAKLGEKVAYLVEVHQAGIFTVQGFEGDELGHLLGSYCPNVLFPYAREAVSGLVSKGGFPQISLSPVNFDALYAQHRQQATEQASQDAVH